MAEIKIFFEKLSNILFPENIKCILCNDEVDENKFCLCDNCAKTDIFCEHICDKCGTPVRSEAEYCLFCSGKRRSFDFARAPLVYTNKVVASIHSFKYDGKKYLAKPFAKLMFESFKTFEDKGIKFDYIIPVPLHKNKLKKRGYNQSELLAIELSKLTDVPTLCDNVVRIKETSTQTELTRKERFENVKDAFEILDKSVVKNKNILIVDDVLTTGATTESLAEKLRRCGCNKICVLAVARADIEKNII